MHSLIHPLTHSLQVPVGPPSEVEEIFDAISYCKGSCVIRMLHGWIGEEVREGGREGGKEGKRDEGPCVIRMLHGWIGEEVREGGR